MAIESLSGLNYRDIIKTEPKISDMNYQAQVENSLSSDKITIASADTETNQKENNEKDQSEKPVLKNQIKSAINNANNKLRVTNTKCEFTYYEEINRVAIKVIDKETEEVIREIPPEETLELVEKLVEFAGILFDERR